MRRSFFMIQHWGFTGLKAEVGAEICHRACVAQREKDAEFKPQRHHARQSKPRVAVVIDELMRRMHRRFD